jgi:hypothetical protein
MCSIPITLALFMPYNFTIFIGQAINGIGEHFLFQFTNSEITFEDLNEGLNIFTYVCGVIDRSF